MFLILLSPSQLDPKFSVHFKINPFGITSLAEMKSLQDKYTRNKTRKLTTHKCSLISTNEFLTLHNNSETVCDNTNCDMGSNPVEGRTTNLQL
jgi:hypothetical protein